MGKLDRGIGGEGQLFQFKVVHCRKDFIKPALSRRRDKYLGKRQRVGREIIVDVTSKKRFCAGVMIV